MSNLILVEAESGMPRCKATQSSSRAVLNRLTVHKREWLMATSFHHRQTNKRTQRARLSVATLEKTSSCRPCRGKTKEVTSVWTESWIGWRTWVNMVRTSSTGRVWNEDGGELGAFARTLCDVFWSFKSEESVMERFSIEDSAEDASKSLLMAMRIHRGKGDVTLSRKQLVWSAET